jgi:DNA-binding NarL/FixJ family response regulator
MSLRILLVDDNPVFLAAVRSFLSIVPDTEVVGVAQDGPQALQLTAQTQPDLVLLDIVMPGMNGLEVAKVLSRQARAPKVLFLSMHDNTFYRKEAQSLGAIGLVGKSNFVTELLPVITTLAAEAGLHARPEAA